MNINIIIPVYNGEKQISNAIRSLVDQTYKGFNAIIVDDGSTDNTKETIQELISEDSRFKYYYKENGGVSSARNFGLEIADSKYITFLDADDFYENDFLAIMYSEIESKSADICYCGYNRLKDGEKSYNLKNFTSENVLYNYLGSKTKIHTTSWMISLDFIREQNIKFDMSLNWSEDILFFSQLLSRTKNVTYIKKPLTNYRADYDEQQLSSFNLNKVDLDFAAYKKLINDESISKDKRITDLLKYYRLQSQIINRLLVAYNLSYELDDIREYYCKYKNYIKPTKLVNGLRSLKVLIDKYKLKRLMMKDKQDKL